MSLPQNLPLNLMQTTWGSALNPVIANAIVQGVGITGITLVANTPLVIQTMLSRMQQGWFLIDNTANCTVWRTQPFNSQNITLEASANTTIAVWMF